MAGFIDNAVACVRAVFPEKCLACGNVAAMPDGAFLCRACAGQVRLRPRNVCSVCGMPLDFDYEIETGDTYKCGECIENPPIHDQGVYALEYKGPVRKLIHKFKYSRQRALAAPLADLGRAPLADWLAGWRSEAVIVPVPLARRKLLSRGYNPAYLLALELARWGGLEVAEGSLRRIKNTTPQFGLDPAQRRKNVKGAFALHDPDVLKGRAVILLDDIYTTGATMEECCRVIEKAKPETILACSLCRAGTGR